MRIEEMRGKTLGYISRRHSFRLNGWRIYVLQGRGDTTGVQIAADYDLKRVLRGRPSLRQSRVVMAEDYYGVIILRVREAHR